MSSRFPLAGSVVCLLLVLVASPGLALAEEAGTAPYEPLVHEASGEAELAIERIKRPEGLDISVFAAEPLLANPVIFTIDDRGRFYVAETFRHHAGVTDTRNHMYWLEDDLASRTVEDRVEMFRKHLREQFPTYAVEHERVRRVVDTDGDGVADEATVFADGFNQIADGIGAGLITRGSQVWYACIPDLWLLEDADDDGVAEQRESLHNGYGVHVGFLGHDLHGLIFGPDGKLYFSIGDRGFHIETPEGTLSCPDTGAVLRCNPDGTELEIFATGLRNPQELVFDDYGNLFTADNNSDSGDQARWVHVLPGSDSGWRIGYQFLNDYTQRGPWNAEMLWLADQENPAGYVLPPLKNMADGPSGLMFDPGVGMPPGYEGCFLLADFRGTSSLSGIRSFRLNPVGATYEVVDEEQFIWALLATDVDLGPDGAIYVSDWVEGWDKPGKGRIYRFTSPATGSDAVQEVQQLLAAGFDQRSETELLALLSHADRRIRQRAQFALADRGAKSLEGLSKVAADPTAHQLARLHAVWGLGQLASQAPQAMAQVLPLLTTADAEVRAQAARVVADNPAECSAAREQLTELLMDPHPRVQLYAALALGKLGQPENAAALLKQLEHMGGDPYLRHATVMGLVHTNNVVALKEAVAHENRHVRLGALLALRRLEDPAVASFLQDQDPFIVAEAARAITGVPIPAAYPQLAALIDRIGEQGAAGLPLCYSQELLNSGKVMHDEMFMRRILNANYRLGEPEHAAALARVAAKDTAPQRVRVEALYELENWTEPLNLDRIEGVWRPLEARPAADALAAIRPVYAQLLAANQPEVQIAASRLIGKLGLTEAAPALTQIVLDAKAQPGLRSEALEALAALEPEDMQPAVMAAVESQDAKLRSVGRRLLARVNPDMALPILTQVLENGSIGERQAALDTLGEVPGAETDAVFVTWMQKLVAGDVPGELRLELLEAAAGRDNAQLSELLAAWEAARPGDSLSARYSEALLGGDSDRGRTIFLEKAAVSCQRCHQIKGNGGLVGPDLSDVGRRESREYLLESIVEPNRKIAKGFDTAVVVLDDGRVVTGVVREETDELLRLVTAEGQFIDVPTETIEVREQGLSAMPQTLIEQLTKRELRDLVEYLSSLK